MAKRVAIMARLSREEKAEGHSVENQVALCERKAKREGWEVVRVIREDGFSGEEVFKRPGIIELLGLVKDGRIDAVLAKDQDRFHRNFFEFEQLLHYHLWPKGIEVHAIDGILDDSSVSKWFERTMGALAAEQYRRTISE